MLRKSHDPQERIITWHNTPLIDEKGNINGTFSSREEFTERKRAENALRESVSGLHSMIDSLPDGVIISDAQDRHILLNHRRSRNYLFYLQKRNKPSEKNNEISGENFNHTRCTRAVRAVIRTASNALK